MGSTYIGKEALVDLTKNLLNSDKKIKDDINKTIEDNLNDSNLKINELKVDKASKQYVQEEIAKKQLQGAGVDTSNFSKRSDVERVDSLFQNVAYNKIKLNAKIKYNGGNVASTGELILADGFVSTDYLEVPQGKILVTCPVFEVESTWGYTFYNKDLNIVGYGIIEGKGYYGVENKVIDVPVNAVYFRTTYYDIENNDYGITTPLSIISIRDSSIIETICESDLEWEYNKYLRVTDNVIDQSDGFRVSKPHEISYGTLIIKMPKFKDESSWGLVFYSESGDIVGRVNIKGGAPTFSIENVTVQVPKNASTFRTTYYNVSNNSWGITDYFECLLIKANIVGKDSRIIKVSAVDSSIEDKANSDFICTGVNDEIILQKALDLAIEKQLVLSSGNYYIDSMNQNPDNGCSKCALLIKKDTQRILRITGNKSTVKSGSPENVFTNGAILHITEACYNSLSDDENYSVIRMESNNGEIIYPHTQLEIEKISFTAPDNQKKIIFLDGYYLSAMSFNQIMITAVKDLNDIHVAVPGCIGIRGLQGSNYGVGNIWKTSFIWGCHEGVAVGGEHVIAMDIGTRFCNYGFTFNNYQRTFGAWTHPITLINCCDECNFNMPIFGDSGETNKTDGQSGRQSINLIDYNLEWLPQYYSLGGKHATEFSPGNTYGSITYTIQPSYGGNSKNSLNIPFWEEGNGSNVRTTNMAHNQVVTTSERKTYAANVLQQAWDTDLNKLVIYDGKKWIDMLGNAVD